MNVCLWVCVCEDLHGGCLQQLKNWQMEKNQGVTTRAFTQRNKTLIWYEIMFFSLAEEAFALEIKGTISVKGSHLTASNDFWCDPTSDTLVRGDAEKELYWQLIRCSTARPPRESYCNYNFTKIRLLSQVNEFSRDTHDLDACTDVILTCAVLRLKTWKTKRLVLEVSNATLHRQPKQDAYNKHIQ